ncbi:MAG: HlyD family efflux transporter periplasmic adaptor subunit [Planctomycetota bacterium]
MLIDDIDLPALEPGAIKNLSVTEGQFIPQGMVVGMIDDDLLLAEYEQQKKRYENARKLAMDEVSIRAAEKEYALALEEFRKADRLFRSRSVSESERNQKKFAAEIANLKMLKAQNDQTTARGEAELELARLAIVQKRIARHVLKSEYDAYVIKIYKKKQEYVQAGEEVMRLGRMDELWAQGNVYASDLDEHNAINRPVTVTLKMADGKTVTFEGRVEQVPLERQSSDQYAVKVRIKNRRANQDVNGSWLLRPLARVSMVIHLDRGFVDDMPDAIRSTPVTPVKGSQLAPLPVGK